ncbi:hypothetical protein ACFX13_048213 [Malus domestica]
MPLVRPHPTLSEIAILLVVHGFPRFLLPSIVDVTPFPFITGLRIWLPLSHMTSLNYSWSSAEQFRIA